MEESKRKQRDSQATPVTIGNNRSVSGSSSDETLIGSSAQCSESSPASPTSIKEEVGSNNSSSLPEDAATKLGGPSQADDTEKNEAEEETDKYWIEKDEERLAVIANMENTLATTSSELANTVTAFQMASDANKKLQAELERKTTSLSRVEEDMNEVVHDLNAADMNNEQLTKDLARSRRDCKHQVDRAEEALTLIKADPSKKTIADILQAKAEAESRNISKQREMESDLETLNSQLKERCDSVARLTRSLSRVADSDQWMDVKRELNELWDRANKFPEELRVALHECDAWKERYHALEDSQEEELQKAEDPGLETVRKVRRQLEEKAAKSERALGQCLKQVFERMVRCTLCLETQGFSPFDRKHLEICKKVVKLLGQDYQQPLIDYYEEHDIQEDFSWKEDDNEDDDEEGRQRVYYVNSEIRARVEDSGRQGNDQDQNDSSIGNHSNFDLQTTDTSSGPIDTTNDSSPTPAPATMETNNVTTTAAEEEEVQNLPESDEAGGKLEAAHTVEPLDKSPTAANQTTKAVAGPTAVVNDAGAIASSDCVRAVEVVSSSETADEAEDVHENTVPATAASTNPEPSKDFTFSQPIFTSERAEATKFSTAAGENRSDTGMPSAFIFGKSFPPIFSATPVAKSREGSAPPGPSRSSKSKEAISPSSADKGSSQNFWGGTSFASAKDKPIFQEVPAETLETKSKESLPTLQSFVMSNSAELRTPASQNSDAKQGSGATKAQEAAAMSTTEKDSIFQQPGVFNFGGVNGPVSFNASSPSLPARATQPASTGAFLVGGQNSPSATVQPKEQANEAGVAKGERSKEYAPKVEASMEKVPEETSSVEEAHEGEQPELDASSQEEKSKGKRSKKEVSKEESMPKESPGPTASKPSRKERKAAKKAQEKAAQKALNEARNAKAEESKRVEKAMRMK